jgi:hypothetical protein
MPYRMDATHVVVAGLALPIGVILLPGYILAYRRP